MKTKGNIKLVGAGPGDKDLVTVKGLNAIIEADIILYDALVNTDLLKESKPGAKLIYVGKRAGAHSSSQEEINLQLLHACMSNEKVVRLKGGDPFVFGRGHEEIEYLKYFGIEAEVIPGISSVTALTAIQKVPLTRRGIAESFWVMTGTTSFGSLSKDVKMAVKSSATLVIAMGINKMGEIARLLRDEGKNDIPIMIIQNGSMSDEKFIISDAEHVVAEMKAKKVSTPGIIIIGEVISLHPDFVKENYTTWINC